MKAQDERILKLFVQREWIHSGHALDLMPRITRLPARIYDLEKKGYVFERGWHGTGASKMRTYKLIGRPDAR